MEIVKAYGDRRLTISGDDYETCNNELGSFKGIVNTVNKKYFYQRSPSDYLLHLNDTETCRIESVPLN